MRQKLTISREGTFFVSKLKTRAAATSRRVNKLK